MNTLLKTGFFFSALLMFQGLKAQDVDALIQEGLMLHEKEKYTEAIRVYHKALDILPESPVINAEIAMSYLYAGDSEKALVYSEKALRLPGGHFSGVYLTKGSALRNMGKLPEAAAAFKEGLVDSGPYYMLHYSLGQVNYLQGLDDEAIAELTQAISLQPNHGNSHLLLGYVMLDRMKKPEALMSLLYFLLLDPGTDRSDEAFSALWSELGNQKSIVVFTTAVSGFLKEISAESPVPVLSFWKKFYFPFFRKLTAEGYSETFALYISRNASSEAARKLNSDPRAFKAFMDWLEAYE